MQDYHIEFIDKADTGPHNLIGEAEIWFDAGILGGMKLVGFSLYRSGDSEIYVTMPARAFGVGGDRRYFDFLRPQDQDFARTRKIKTLILDEYKKRNPSTLLPKAAARP